MVLLHLELHGDFKLSLVFVCSCCFFIPESPRWLAKQGQWEAAEEIVAKVQAHGDRENQMF